MSSKLTRPDSNHPMQVIHFQKSVLFTFKLNPYLLGIHFKIQSLLIISLSFGIT